MTAINASTRTQHPVHYKTLRVGDLDIFTAKLVRKTAPVILLLHASQLRPTCFGISFHASPAHFTW